MKKYFLLNMTLSKEAQDVYLAVDLSESNLELADLLIKAGHLEGVKKHVDKAHKYLKNGPPFEPHRSLEKEKTWKEAVANYNAKAQLYRNLGIEVKTLEEN
ncbi:hypothetical protein KY314_04170 [Candidatus Woesearchaeota archaeon]|nr:hypothetical protein [Candidatus Woesearchaeota archaeon]